MLALPYRSLGEPPAPPWRFRFPDAGEYSARLVGGLDELYAGGDWAVAEMSPPCQTSAAGMVASVESASGLDIGQLVVRGVAGDMAPVLQQMMGQLVSGALELAVEATSAAVASTIGDALEVVPVLGQIVSGLIGLAVGLFEEDRRQTEMCKLKLELALNQYCGQVTEGARVKSTAVRGPTPADQFRQIAYAYQAGERLPLTPASMYVLLCGGETGGFGFASEAQYRSWVRREAPSAIRPVGAPAPGIESPELRRKMWKLIQGIMGAVEDPRWGVPPTDRDQGRSLMPLLQGGSLARRSKRVLFRPSLAHSRTWRPPSWPAATATG